MLREITLEQYYPADSVIHGLDPRAKLFGTMVFIASLFIADNIWGYVIATLVPSTTIKIIEIPFRFIVKGLKVIMILLIISVSFNLFLTDGQVVVKFWIFKIMAEGVRLAFFMGLRLVYLVIGSSIMTLTATPSQLTDGLEKGLGFLRRFRVSVHEVSMMMSIALRPIPTLVEETDKITKARVARGADFDTGNLIQRTKAMVPLLVPLFISAFCRATDLAMTMGARCYEGGKGRTKMKPLRYKREDHDTYMIFALYLMVMIASRVYLQNGAPKVQESGQEEKTKRVRFVVACDGTHYHGQQIQPGGVTIESELSEKLTILLGEPIQVIGVSRTDLGVHARGNVVVFGTKHHMPTDKICLALNQRLPEDTRVQSSEEVAAGWHPGEHRCIKTYEYEIMNRRIEMPTQRLYSRFCCFHLDLDQMCRAADILTREHDFESFCNVHTQVTDTVRIIYSPDIRRDEEDITTIRVTGNGFLYNMVRIIAGTLVAVGMGQIHPGEMEQILEAREQRRAGPTVPARGLTLIEMKYVDQITFL